MSNDSVVTAGTHVLVRSPAARAMARRKFTTARCGSPTPLGWPVEPEV